MSTRRGLGWRSLAAAAAAVVLLAGISGCGMDVSTLQSYTPAQGVNADIGGIKVRNLLVIADDKGRGIVSGSIISASADTLTGLSGVALKPDESPGTPLVVTSDSIRLPAATLVLLTQGQQVTVSSPDLKPGLNAYLRLTFQSGESLDITTPVKDNKEPAYETITPSPEPSK